MTKNSEYHNYNTRNQSDLRIPLTRLKKVRQSFLCKGIELWNKISQNIKTYKPRFKFKSNINYFKKNIKKKLFLNILYSSPI